MKKHRKSLYEAVRNCMISQNLHTVTVSPWLLNRGNYRGVSPYRRGSSCSGCGQETCENNLCRKCSYNRKTLIRPNNCITLYLSLPLSGNSTRDALQSKCLLLISQHCFTSLTHNHKHLDVTALTAVCICTQRFDVKSRSCGTRQEKKMH